MKPYSTLLTIEGARAAGKPSVRISVPAEYMDGSLDEPLAESCVESSIRRATFIVKTADLGGIVPQIGDIVRGEDGIRYAVSKVQPFYTREYIMDCKSC